MSENSAQAEQIIGCQPLNLLELDLILEWNRSAEYWNTTGGQI